MNRMNFFKLTLVVIVILVIALIVINVTKKPNTQAQNTTQNGQNYVEGTDGTKVNNSEDLNKDKVAEGIKVESPKLVYTNGATRLTANVTNTSTETKNVSLKIIFLDDKGATIAESVGYVGSILPNETRQLDSTITTDVANAKDIRFEITK